MTNAVSLAQQASTGVSPGFRNRIINGAMVIDQRNAGASVTPTGTNTYTIDRWKFYLSQASKFSTQQNQGSVTPPAGFSNYLGATSLSAYTVGASENFILTQVIEGFNTSDLGWGTANAKTVTLSFWVRSSLTGTFGGAFGNTAGDRSYPFTYTISSANTWEQKSITVVGDTSGTWGTGNASSIFLYLSLGAGSTVSGTAGAWAGAFYASATGATSVVGTNGATFYITGVQLEVGSSATSFEYRPYGTELSLCQRYFLKLGGDNTYQKFAMGMSANTNNSYGIVVFPVQMRANPTMSYSSLSDFRWTQGTNSWTASALGVDQYAVLNTFMQIDAAGSPFTQYRPGWLDANGTTNAKLMFSAEL